MIAENIQFRLYSDKDLPRCAGLARQAWPAGNLKGPTTLEMDMMEAYVRWSLLASTWAEVAEDSGEVVGLLFGRIGRQRFSKNRRDSVLSDLRMMVEVLAGKHGWVPGFLRMMFGFSVTEVKLLINRPPSDAEITLLLVDKGLRGKGIGRALVDHFMTAARDAGSSIVMVYTDDQSSNWQFYEVYGFRKVASFFDNGTTYFNRRRTNGLLYTFDLKNL